MSSVSTAFTVRFLKNGDNIAFGQNVYKDSGDGTSLFQVIDVTSGEPTPNWGTTANQPILAIFPRSAIGYTVGVTAVQWSYDGTDLTFVLDGSNWVTATNDSRFQSRINATTGYHELRIVANLGSSSVLGNKQIGYEVTYRSNGKTGTYNGFATVEIAQGGTDGHYLRIGVQALDVSNLRGGMTLGNVEVGGTIYAIAQTTLTADCYYGGDSVTPGSGNYSIQWYKDGVAISGATSASLTVTRDDVDGGSVFVAKLMYSGEVVAQDGQRVIDNADEYQIVATPSSAAASAVSYVNGVATNAVHNLTVTKNNASMSQEGITFAWQIYNALGVAKTSGTGSTVTITPSDCLIAGDSIDSSEAVFDDVDVQVSATL